MGMAELGLKPPDKSLFVGECMSRWVRGWRMRFSLWAMLPSWLYSLTCIAWPFIRWTHEPALRKKVLGWHICNMGECFESSEYKNVMYFNSWMLNKSVMLFKWQLAQLQSGAHQLDDTVNKQFYSRVFSFFVIIPHDCASSDEVQVKLSYINNVKRH